MPPLITVLEISAMYLGMIQSILWIVQIYAGRNPLPVSVSVSFELYPDRHQSDPAESDRVGEDTEIGSGE